MSLRAVKKIVKARPTIEGAGVHSHRGIETITYVLSGVVEHKDSLGNTESLAAGDAQWMTAGSGIPLVGRGHFLRHTPLPSGLSRSERQLAGYHKQAPYLLLPPRKSRSDFRGGRSVGWRG